MDHRFANFISETVVELLENKVDVYFCNKRYLEEGLAGYFDNDPMTIKIAVKKPLKYWFPVYLHEFCHYRQWKENSKYWKASDDIFFDWLGGEEYTQREIFNSWKIHISVELDCEKRVVEIIQRKELPINIEHYIRCSNAYLLSMSLCYRHRSLFNKPPYEDESIIKKMPSYFLTDKTYLTITNKHDRVFRKFF